MLRCCRQPGDAGVGPEVLKGSQGRVEGGMLDVAVAGSAAPMCDRSRMVCPRETRFAGTLWHRRGWGWLSKAPRWLGELRVGAKRGLCLDLGMAEPEKRLCELLERETLRPC